MRRHLFFTCISAVFLAHNPVSANVFFGTQEASSSKTLTHTPMPVTTITDLEFIPTVLIAQTTLQDSVIDVTLLDDFIKKASPNIRHYPPNFPNRSQRYNAKQHLKVLVDWIDQYAQMPNASYDVLIRAAQLNGMARNLDMGSDYAVRGSNYVSRALAIHPDSVEGNVLYGIMLSEGGAYRQGKKYLDRAIALGSIEAEQSIAQIELMSNQRTDALKRLRNLQMQHPNNAIINKQVNIAESGLYRLWDIDAPNPNLSSLN